ncbi:MAG: hypothetical protein KKA79_07495 [Nanoarchaeota archaeon]|nr:hypothetical protein [Nanoarchaeota archaeon]
MKTDSSLFDPKPSFVKRIFADPSSWSLILANIVTLVWAIKESRPLASLMLVYWVQSVILGFFQFIKILSLEKVPIKNISFSGETLESTRKTRTLLTKISSFKKAPDVIQKTKILIALIFAFHYGSFHLYYLSFLNKTVSTQLILVTGGTFFINHLFSYLYNKEADEKQEKSIRQIMVYPYVRILPMHLTIILGSIFNIFFGGIVAIIFGPALVHSIPLVIFTTLKTAVDVAMHTSEHSSARV